MPATMTHNALAAKLLGRSQCVRPFVGLFEDVDMGSGPMSRVDRKNGILRGAKVLGYDSKNGYSYEPAGIDPAIYDDVPVNINHQNVRTGERSNGTADRFGWLRNPQKRSDGIYADLYVLMNHPMAETVFEAAEKNPRMFGLSQVVKAGDFDVDERTNKVLRIRKIQSADVVPNPATTNGLFESTGGGVSFGARALVEACLVDDSNRAPLPGKYPKQAAKKSPPLRGYVPRHLRESRAAAARRVQSPADLAARVLSHSTPQQLEDSVRKLLGRPTRAEVSALVRATLHH